MILIRFSAAFRTATINNIDRWLLPKCSFQKQLLVYYSQNIYENKRERVLLKWSCANQNALYVSFLGFSLELALFFYKDIERPKLMWEKAVKNWNIQPVVKFFVRSEDSDLKVSKSVYIAYLTDSLIYLT